MTQLTIIPKIADKTARFKGTIAAGEHVAVAIENADGGIGSTDNLRLRIVGHMGETLAEFPQSESADPSRESTSEMTDNEWESSGGVISCIFNLDTANLLAAVPPAATMSLLFVLDDAESDTLYFKDRCDVVHWPQRRGEDNPVDLRGYRDFVEETKRRVNEAVAAAQAAQDAAEHTPGMPGPQGPRGIQGTPAPCWRMRDANGDWHNVGLSENDYGDFSVAVDQSSSEQEPDPEGGGDVSFNALTWPEQKDEHGVFVKVPNTELRELTDRFADEWNVVDFGADPTGVSDSSAAIQHAIDAAQPGDRVVFPNGTYKVENWTNDGVPTTGVVIDKDDITIDGCGATLLLGNSYSFFHVKGSFETDSSKWIGLASAVERRDDVLNVTVPSGQSVNVGEWYALHGQRDAFNPDACGADAVLGAATSGVKNIQFLEPVCISSVALPESEGAPTKVRLQDALAFEGYEPDNSNEPVYTVDGVQVHSSGTKDGSYLKKLNFVEGVLIKNFDVKFSGSGAGGAGPQTPRLASFTFCRACSIENVRVNFSPFDSKGGAAHFTNCLLCRASNVRMNRKAGDTGIEGHQDYACFKCVSSWYQVFDSCVMENGFQAIDFSYSSDGRTGGQSNSLTGPNIYPVVSNCKFRGCVEQGITSHGGTWGLRVTGCEFSIGRQSSAGNVSGNSNVCGISLRSPFSLVDNCRFIGKPHSTNNKFVVGILFDNTDVYEYKGEYNGSAAIDYWSLTRNSVVKNCVFVGLDVGVEFKNGYARVDANDSVLSPMYGPHSVVESNEFHDCGFSVYTREGVPGAASSSFWTNGGANIKLAKAWDKFDSGLVIRNNVMRRSTAGNGRVYLSLVKNPVVSGNVFLGIVTQDSTGVINCRNYLFCIGMKLRDNAFFLKQDGDGNVDAASSYYILYNAYSIYFYHEFSGNYSNHPEKWQSDFASAAAAADIMAGRKARNVVDIIWDITTVQEGSPAIDVIVARGQMTDMAINNFVPAVQDGASADRHELKVPSPSKTGSLRDFYVHLTLPANAAAPTIALKPIGSSATIKLTSADGQFPTIATSTTTTATTLLHFVETAANKFFVSGTELQEIQQGGGS